MNVYYLQQLWLDETYYAGTDVQRNYWTFDLPKVNIKATIALTIASFGLRDGKMGFAATGIKRYEYVDDYGIQRRVEMDHFQSHLTVRNCVSITFALDVSDAWAGAVGMMYWFE